MRDALDVVHPIEAEQQLLAVEAPLQLDDLVEVVETLAVEMVGGEEAMLAEVAEVAEEAEVEGVAVELVALSLSSDESSIFSNLAQSMPHGKASTVTAVWFFESRMYLDSTETSVPSTRELAFIKWRT